MNIAVLTDGFPPYSLGGAETVASNLAGEFVEQGHAVSVITAVRSKEDAGTEQIDGVSIHKVFTSYHHRWAAYKAVRNPQAVRGVRSVLKDKRPDVLHAHNIHNLLSYESLKVARDLGVPTLLTLHDAMTFDYGKFTQFIDRSDLSDDPSVRYKISPLRTLRTYRFRYFPLRNFLIRRYIRRYADQCVAVSRELRSALLANGIRCSSVVHNGIDVGQFATTPSHVRAFVEKHGLADKKVVLFGGRLSYLKGGDHLVRAMARVAAKVPDAVLLVLDNADGYARRLRSIAKDLGIGQVVVSAGWLTGADLRAAYGASHLVVTPSICWDSFPTMNIEAMAMSKPVVATCFGGSKEVVVHGETGYIVNPLNVERLASRITELLLDDEKAKQMGEMGHRRIVQDFKLKDCARRYLDILEGLKRDHSVPDLLGRPDESAAPSDRP